MSCLDKARLAWGSDLPDWVTAIAEACDLPDASQNKVSRDLGYSSAVISQVLTNRYPGDLNRVADVVRKRLMHAEVICPALGQIKEVQCDAWRAEVKELQSSSPMVVRMYRACRQCDRFNEGKT